MSSRGVCACLVILPFKVRLMLLSMLCDMINNKPQQDKPSINSGVAVRRFIFLSCRQNAFLV